VHKNEKKEIDFFVLFRQTVGKSYNKNMHIILDIREPYPYSTIISEYGIQWAELWKKYRPCDQITFLIHDFQEKKDSNYIIIPTSPFFFSKKLIAYSWNEVFRFLSFSPLGIYDASIPSIIHIWDNTDWLYPSKENEWLLQRKLYEYKKRSLIKKATTVIVPNIATGNELVELWQTPEEKIEIIPYIHQKKESEISPTSIWETITESYYIYDAWYHGGANIMGILKSFKEYRENLDGKCILVFYGFLGEELSRMTHAIRSLDIVQSVKIMGVLPYMEKHRLYSRAKWWIAPGAYYAWWVNIELACTYRIPLLLADIWAFQSYKWIKIHPNHNNQLAHLLKKLEGTSFIPQYIFEEELFMKAYEKCFI
jgi:hypothetical protein